MPGERRTRGSLTNPVVRWPEPEPSTFGIADLMRNLAARKLI
jgi:fumarylacetoacetate (FAA) hydrolase family protein